MYKINIISKAMNKIKAKECPIEKSLNVIFPTFNGPCTANTKIIETPTEIIPFT